MSKGISVNRSAWKILDKLLEYPALLGIKVDETSNGIKIIDAGIEAHGGFQAGKLITEICMGGLAEAGIDIRSYGNLEMPTICVRSDQPVIATLGSQYAGWRIKEGDYFAIGSGPARALAKKPKEIFRQIDYEDDADVAIIVLETDKVPPAGLIERFVSDCHVRADRLALILAATASIAGVTQVAGRIVETGIHKLVRLGVDPNTILYACGSAPIPPVHPQLNHAMARTNDAILYGGIAYYALQFDDDAELARIAEKAPSRASKTYGKPFLETLKQAGYDFYSIDPDLFAPAKLILNNVRTGSLFAAGDINVDVLVQSMGFRD